MANALAPLMPDQRQQSATMPAPAPMAVAPPMANALSRSNPYAAAPKKPQHELVGLAVDGFQRGFDPEGWKAGRDEGKANAQEKQKQTLALMQQQRALPEAQRTQWWQQNASTIGQIIGQDLSQQPVDATQFSDDALDGNIAALSGQLGISPVTQEPMSAYEAAQIKLKEQEAAQGPKPQIYSTSKGLVEAAPGVDPRVVFATDPDEKPPWVGAVKGEDGQWAYDPNYISGYREMHPRNPNGGGSKSRFRPASREEAARYGAEAGQIDDSTGRFYASGGQNAGEFSASERKSFRDKTAAINTLKYLVNDYRKSVKEFGPQLMDTESDGGLGFRKTDRSQQLLAKHNNLMMFLKGPELFNLGVLTGPDVERLQRTLPEPVGPGTVGQNKDTLGVGLNSLDQFVDYKLSLIPESFRSGEAKAQSKGAATGAAAAGAAMAGLTQPSKSTPQPAVNDDDMDGMIDSLFPADDGGDEGPQEGLVEDGYRFLGGNPADPANWEQVQ